MALVITGLDNKQSAILESVVALPVAMQDALQLVSPVLRQQFGLQNLAKVAEVLVDIGRETGGDAHDIVSVLGLVRASRQGKVLSPSPVRVQIDDDVRRAWADIQEDEGILLEQGRGLSLYCLSRQESFELLGAVGCEMWEASPAALAEFIDSVYLYIDEQGSVDSRLYIGDCQMEEFETAVEFFRTSRSWSEGEDA